MNEKHQSPIKTPRQLIIVVTLAFIVPVAVFVMLTQLFTGGMEGATENKDAVLARIKPVGDIVMADASAPKGQMTGEQVFNQVCKTCHETGIAGAHKVGDKGAWSKVIAQGPAVTLQHALSGIRAMPPRGGNPDLTDVEVERAVVYMVNKSGGNWKEPAAPTATAAAPAGGATNASAVPAAPAAATSTAPPAAAPATSAAAPAAKADGKKVYETVCMVCHGTGVAGAPKLGDKAAWAPRIKSGMDALH